jgi:hypothetical protein
VAPSTIGTEGGGTSNDALATIAGLKQRVEWLEESIGRLLLAKEQQSASASQSENANEVEEDGRGMKRHNCCVTFSDASPDMERAVGRGDNCCVSFKSGGTKTRERERQMRWMGVGCFCFVVVVVGFTVIMTSWGKGAVAASALEGVEGGLNV